MIEKTSPRDKWPLTFAERQMAAEQSMDPGSCAYNVNLVLEITGPLDASRLEQALSALVKRHTAFRSYYPMENGEFVHRIADDVPVTLYRETHAPDNTPYDLSCVPLFRFTLYQNVLYLAMHHIIMDGTSEAVMLDEIWRLYSGEELPPVALAYTDYAVWQSEQPEDKDGKAFFTEMFADGVPENEMPTKPRRPDVLPFAEVDCESVIDVKGVDEAARKYGVTTYQLLFAAVGLTLAKYCGSEDVTLGTAMSGRSLKQTAGMVGMFVNTLPVRVKAPGLMTVGEYVKTVSDTIRQVKKHQTYPFEKIVPMLAPDRNASRSPVFDVIVNYRTEIPLPEVQGTLGTVL